MMAAPVSKTVMLGGKMLPNLVVTLVQIAVIFAAGTLILPLIGWERMTLGSDIPALLAVSLLLGVCSTGLGVFIVGFARTDAQIGGISVVLLWVMAALGGSFFPTFLMSGVLRGISTVIPHSWALRAYNDLLVSGGGFLDIIPEMGVLLAFAAVFFAVGLWRFDFD